ncbi:type II toxin-antitoxin system PemK/MazF family toxin [Patescibacteria group bacterium]|nr:type II toxin-antitoxin system PemK/MazF family toxin [Patescibacteria group bacterium]
MIKDFDKWNKNKKKLENRDSNFIKCKRKEIWLCKIGENIGNEIGKSKPFVRPVLIVNIFMGGDLILIFPLTTKYNQYLEKFYFYINKGSGLNKNSYVCLNQIKVISKKRLIKRIINNIGEENYSKIIEKFKKNIEL